MHDSDAFRAFVARVGEFHVTERGMSSAQKRMESLIAAGQADDVDRRAYVDAVRRYFTGFEREARGHLRTLDRRLEQVNQVQFNLNAERGVAVRRIQATQDVLARLLQVVEDHRG